MTDISSVASEIMAKLPLYRQAPITMSQAVEMAKRHVPGHPAGFIENVAKEMLRMDRLEQGLFEWCERCKSYHHESAPHIDRPADTPQVRIIRILSTTCLTCRTQYKGGGECPVCTPNWFRNTLTAKERALLLTNVEDKIANITLYLRRQSLFPSSTISHYQTRLSEYLAVQAKLRAAETAPVPIGGFQALLNEALDASFACGEHDAIHQEDYAALRQQFLSAKHSVLAEYRRLLKALEDVTDLAALTSTLGESSESVVNARTAIADAKGKS